MKVAIRLAWLLFVLLCILAGALYTGSGGPLNNLSGAVFKWNIAGGVVQSLGGAGFNSGIINPFATTIDPVNGRLFITLNRPSSGILPLDVGAQNSPPVALIGQGFPSNNGPSSIAAAP